MSTVIGLDTSGSAVAAAVVRDGECIAETRLEPPAGERPRHAEVLLPEVERLASAAGGWRAVDRIAVGIGPGWYTGLRVGIATARALAQALGKPLAAVVSLDALAAGISESADDGPFLAVTDARRSQVFAALYAPDGSRIWAPFVAAPQELVGRIAGLDSPPLAAGDGALLFEPELSAAGARVRPDPDPAHRLAPRHLCRLGAAAPANRPEDVNPLYLRPPDAQRWLERDRG